MLNQTSGAPRVVLLAVIGVLGLIGTACFSSTPPPTDAAPVVQPEVTLQPTEEALEVDDDVRALVEDYWLARDAAWSLGPAAGIQFSLDFNHPLLDYTSQDCADAWFGGVPPGGFAERSDLQEETVRADPDFRLTVGPLAGRDLGEGLVAMQVLFTYEGLGTEVASRLATVHLQVIDGEVRHFLLCEDSPVTIVEISSDSSADADGSGQDGTGTTGDGSGSLQDPVTVLPPVTVTPAPVSPPADGGSGGDDGGDGDGGGGGSGGGAPNPPGSRPPGTGVDFCDTPPSGDAPSAGDYYLCPDDDVDPTATATPTPQPSDDITRG